MENASGTIRNAAPDVNIPDPANIILLCMRMII